MVRNTSSIEPATTIPPRAEHDCGMCDGKLRWDGVGDGFDSWVCTVCGWWHTSKDCCELTHL